MTSDENLTSREAGNSPEMIYKNYREVVTLKAAEKWFSVRLPYSGRFNEQDITC